MRITILEEKEKPMTDDDKTRCNSRCYPFERLVLH